jgi:hypothetical protein
MEKYKKYIVWGLGAVAVGTLVFFFWHDLNKMGVEDIIEQNNKVLQDKIDTLSAKQQALLYNAKEIDTVIVYQVEKPVVKNINKYYYENNRIDNLSDSGQFGLLSKNIADAKARERRGDFDHVSNK